MLSSKNYLNVALALNTHCSSKVYMYLTRVLPLKSKSTLLVTTGSPNPTDPSYRLPGRCLLHTRILESSDLTSRCPLRLLTMEQSPLKQTSIPQTPLFASPLVLTVTPPVSVVMSRPLALLTPLHTPQSWLLRLVPCPTQRPLLGLRELTLLTSCVPMEQSR